MYNIQDNTFSSSENLLHEMKCNHIIDEHFTQWNSCILILSLLAIFIHFKQLYSFVR